MSKSKVVSLNAVPAQPGRIERGEQALITCSPQVVTKCSIDTLHLSLWCDLSESDLLAEIIKSRDIAREYEQDKVPFVYFSTDFNVHRSGRRHFQYHISSADTHIFFNKRSADQAFPTCLIEIGSLSCWTPGPFQVFESIKSFFDFAGVKIVKHNVSRVDLAADLVGQDFEKLDLPNINKWVSRANKFSVHYSGRSCTGISLGKGNIMLRVYDKKRELSDKKATAKQRFFERIWQDKDSPVTRVEFQLRREVLKEFRFGDEDSLEVHTIEEIQAAQNALWSYCSREWARHTEKNVDFENKNHKQSKISDFWRLVQGSQFNEIENNHYRKKRRTDHINIEALVAQGSGCLLAAAACSMEAADDIKQAVKIACKYVSTALYAQFNSHGDKFVKKVRVVQAINKAQFSY